MKAARLLVVSAVVVVAVLVGALASQGENER